MPEFTHSQRGQLLDRLLTLESDQFYELAAFGNCCRETGKIFLRYTEVINLLLAHENKNRRTRNDWHQGRAAS